VTGWEELVWWSRQDVVVSGLGVLLLVGYAVGRAVYDVVWVVRLVARIRGMR